MQFISFLTEYIKHPRNIGAVMPSSNRLSKKMVDLIDFEKAECIVELGPGTGPFTREMIKRKKTNTKIVLIETNEVFFKKLQAQYSADPSIVVIHGSAEDVKKYTEALSIEKVDYIISGLPFTSLPLEVSTRILTSVNDTLHENGEFITFQYTLMKKSFIQHFFSDISLNKVWFNFPPAYVFKCTNEIG